MIALPKLRKRLPSGSKVTIADIVDCPLVKIWTTRAVVVGWLADVTDEHVDVISTVPTDQYGNGWRHRLDRTYITNVRVIAEPA